MLENTYQIDNKMSYYATSDQKIGLLFAESLDEANEQGDIDNYLNSNNLNHEDVLFVIFHAGLGQEASQRFDPTIYDIKSAYVDDDMLEEEVPAKEKQVRVQRKMDGSTNSKEEEDSWIKLDEGKIDWMQTEDDDVLEAQHQYKLAASRLA